MALPWFAEEARLYSKYDFDFQLVYIASSGINLSLLDGMARKSVKATP